MNESTLKNSATECWFWAGWEPRRHYRRRGGSPGTFYFGDGEWVEAWERRLFSDEGIQHAADLGATILMTQFYKGMGRRVESLLWPELRGFVSRCHGHGIKVWGYVQGASLYPEILRAEQPELDDWTARSYSGSLQKWGASYFRNRPCLTSPGYRDYFLGIAREGVRDIGLDGLQIDNNYYPHCWCERCQRKFREWLAARGDLEERTGIPDPAFVDAPPLPDKAERISDPLKVLFIQFGVEVRQDFYRSVREAVREENPAAAVSGNPGFPRGGLASKLKSAFDPSREAEIFDFVGAENGNQTRIENGAFVGQSEAFLFAEAGGYRAWGTSWRSGAFRHSPPPDAGAVWAVMAEEFSYGSAMPGNNWAFRPSGEGAGFLHERLGELAGAFREAGAFFRELARCELATARHSWTDVDVLVDPHSLSIGGPDNMHALREAMQYFQAAKIPARFVFPSQDIPESTNTLVVWGINCLSRTAMARLTDFARRPGRRVVLSDSSGLCDEWQVPYDFARVREWRNQPGFYIIEAGKKSGASVTNEASFFHDEYSRLGDTLRERFDAFFQTPQFPRRMRFDAPDFVLVHTEKTDDGRLLVHLRDQSGSGQPINGAEAWLAVGQDSASFYAPGLGRVEVASEKSGEGRLFRLPEFSRYGLLVLPEKP